MSSCPAESVQAMHAFHQPNILRYMTGKLFVETERFCSQRNMLFHKLRSKTATTLCPGPCWLWRSASQVPDASTSPLSWSQLTAFIRHSHWHVVCAQRLFFSTTECFFYSQRLKYTVTKKKNLRDCNWNKGLGARLPWAASAWKAASPTSIITQYVYNF